MTRTSGPAHAISTYEISDRELPSGSTLGAPKGTMLIKATGAIEKVFSCEAGIDVFGSFVLHHWDETSGIPLIASPGRFIIHPDHQEHRFMLTNGVSVREDLFMLNSTPQGEDLHTVDPPGAYFTVVLENASEEPLTIATYASICLPGEHMVTEFDGARHAIVARSKKEPRIVRIAACSVRTSSHEVTLDSHKASATHFPGKLSNTTCDSADDPIGIFHLSHLLRPAERASFYFVLTFSVEGEDAAREAFRALPNARDAFARTHAHYSALEDCAVVMTPDSEVNRGVFWAKANILRTQSLTSQGWCFTNDPTRSNNSVGRDTAWYSLGSDFVTPYFSKESLLWYVDHLKPEGMVYEYFDIRDGKPEDYGLNINDDTPLVLMATWHHYCTTGDRAFLEYVYPKMKHAAEYIWSQRNDQGLVWCTADKTADWGIVGWRNIIEGYRLSGATTEINAECFAALRTIGHMATELENYDDARVFSERSEELRVAINEHLLDKKRNVYYLNIDIDGTPRTDVTCDLVFPVMFRASEHDISANIISRLSIPEFWSDAGLHTVPRNDINYSPTRGSGLLGGVWSGPSFWFAFAAAGFNPDFMAFALSATFKHYSQDPKRNNTVPGQFSEWLHGETLTNQGMMLSPWFAPKYLWSAIEGAGGLEIDGHHDLKPRLADAWSWLGVRNIALRGKNVSWFAGRVSGQLNVYANYAFPSIDSKRQFEDDISTAIHVTGDSVVRVALHRPDCTVICVGNTLDRTVTTALSISDERLQGRYLMRAYNTLRNEWIEEEDFDLDRLRVGLPLQVSRQGFFIIELYAQS